MARWRLTQKHYLNVPGTEFEYRETTHYGKQVRKNFPVPLYLDPENPGDCNYNADGESRGMGNQNTPGEIIVAWADGAERPRDIIFVGDPTIDMVPLDDAAKEVSASMSAKWGRAFIGDDEDEGGYTNRLLTELTETLNSFNATAKPSAAVSEEGSSRLSALEGQVKQMFEMNMALLAKLDPPGGQNGKTPRI